MGKNKERNKQTIDEFHGGVFKLQHLFFLVAGSLPSEVSKAHLELIWLKPQFRQLRS